MGGKLMFAYGQKTGKKHIPQNIPCQDKAYCKTLNGVTVAVLSDGCGSSDISQYGADIIIEVMSNLLVTEFDYLYETEKNKCKKIIIELIVKYYQQFIDKNTNFMSEYKKRNLHLFRKYRYKNENDFFLNSLSSTLLFTANKDDKYIFGQVGDGFISVVYDNMFKILMEEEKSENINGTLYPIDIYTLAKSNPQWYESSAFKYFQTNKYQFDAAILFSDGPDSLLRLEPFKKTMGLASLKLFDFISTSSFEDSQTHVDELLDLLVDKSRSLDDCSLAIIVKENFSYENVECISKEIKEEHRPVVIRKKPIEQYQENISLLEKILSEQKYKTYLQIESIFMFEEVKYDISILYMKILMALKDYGEYKFDEQTDDMDIFIYLKELEDLTIDENTNIVKRNK